MSRLRLHEEDGISLIELLIGIVLMAIVMSLISTSAVHAMKVQRRQVAAVEAMNRGRIAMERITREIRAANPLLAASTDGREISVQVTRGETGNNRKITTYRVAGEQLQALVQLHNTTTDVTTTLPAQTLIADLDIGTNPVFTYELVDGSSPSPLTPLHVYRTVNIRLVVDVSEGPSLVLKDSVTIRNSTVIP